MAQAPGALAEEPPRVLVVDRQPLFLAALSGLLSDPPLQARVTVATRSDEALRCLETEPCDLVLCELRAQPISGTDLAASLVQQSSRVKVVLLADREDERHLISAMQCGASGFFTKDTSYEDLLDGLQAVRTGHYVMGQNLLQPTLARLRGEPSDVLPGASQLSPAERSILTMIGMAESVPAIAAARGISQKTVRNHLASIYRKLELRSRTEAILCAARLGLTPPDLAARD
jgi:DNA-binding NarL/FixJ family response regulator